MGQSVVLISHLRVKPGKLDELRKLTEAVTGKLRDDKPGTVAFACYLNDDGTRLTIVHVFPDADAMDRHFVGSDERGRVAYELAEPAGWEIYGAASATALDTMRRAAADADVPLIVDSEYVAGFLRLRPPAPVAR